MQAQTSSKTANQSCFLCRYELQIATIRLLDFYGGAADLTPQEFFAADVSCKINIGTDLES